MVTQHADGTAVDLRHRSAEGRHRTAPSGTGPRRNGPFRAPWPRSPIEHVGRIADRASASHTDVSPVRPTDPSARLLRKELSTVLLVTRGEIVYRMWVDFDAYAQTAADLANAKLDDMDDLRSLLGDRVWWRDRATERDLATFRRAQRKLRDVFVKGAEKDDASAVGILNALLEQFPVQPRIAGHTTKNWHMHVTGRGTSVAAEYIAGAAWGLSAWLCRFDGGRFGVCADSRCGNVYLDTSSNCCRRFCSERCATRSHVAAHRARKREAAAAAAA